MDTSHVSYDRGLLIALSLWLLSACGGRGLGNAAEPALTRRPVVVETLSPAEPRIPVMGLVSMERIKARAAVIAIFLIYIVLVIGFRSLTQPVLIILAIPMSLIGSTWGLVLSSNPLSFTAFLGMITLTSITTIAGLLPLSLTGGDFFGPFGFAMIGGLAASTVLTLVVQPAAYLALERRRKRPWAHDATVPPEPQPTAN